LMLAAAGVKRLGLADRLTTLVPVDVCVPAPGQGIVAIELRDDTPAALKAAIADVSDADAEAALLAERAVVTALGGGCQMPLGALARLDGQDLRIDGLVASLDGRTILRGVAHGNRGGAAAIGEKLAAQLVAKGASELLLSSR
jgi:hydroxymethylbilane synthase